MKQRWIAFLLACVIAMGAMGAFAVMADAAITEEPAAAGSADAGENAEAAAPQTDAATVTFDFSRLGAVPLCELLSGKAVAAQGARLTWTLPPGEIAVFEIRER